MRKSNGVGLCVNAGQSETRLQRVNAELQCLATA